MIKNPEVFITLQSGKQIVIEMYPEYAPNTVNNFIYLAKKKFFDGMAFVRVVNDRLIQQGDPNMPGPDRTDVTPGYIIEGEFNREGYSNPLSFKVGVVGMAMAADEITPNASAGSFFIMTKDEETLDAIVPAFGKVIEGLDVVMNINRGETHKDFGYDAPCEAEFIERVVIELYDYKSENPIKIYE